MGGISCALKNPVVQISIPGAGDIVLCEYSSVGMILGLVREKKINFRSICIDCRHPEGMFGSVGTYNSNSRHNSGWHGASELITAEWWDNVIALASREDIRRLIVDYCDPDIYSLQRSGLGQRQQLEIMSLRTAFLVGPRTFRPSNYSLPRTVISWARHQDKKCGEDKFERVRRVLQETLSPLSTCDGRPLCSFPFTTWEIRECEMPYAQRAAYDSCCSHIRGALSSSLGVANTQDDFGSSTYHAIATALFRLRQICLCSSNLDRRATGEKILSGERLPFIHTEPCSVDTAPTEASLFKMASDNSSQQDHELAEALLSNSGKFSQLIAILEKECGYTLDCDKDVRKLIECAWSGKAVDVAFRRKVVILANLPMTQWLVSILLGSLGIRHKLIRREFSHTSNPSNEEVRKHKQAALSWAESQTTLTAFNSEEHIRDKLGIYASSDVLIVSPDSLASWHGGVGIDNADFVISLDEDWSGRELGTLEAAMSRWKAITTLRKSSSKTIRLICKNSIEMRVFSKGTSNSFQYPLDQSGNHLLYRDIDELIPIYREAVESRAETANLPGIDILQLRGEALQEVLLPSKRLAPLFGNGSSLLFLPLTYDNEVPEKRDYAEVKRELSFLRALFELECRETSKDLSSSFTDSFTFTKKLHFGSGVLPPEPRSFPEHVMSRSDLQFLSIRYYFERQVVSSGPSSSASNGVALLQVCLPGEKAPNNVVSPADGHSQDGSAFADAWQKSGLGSKSDEKAKSLLCYRANDEQTAIEHNNKDSFDGGRFNVYSKIYSSTWESNAVQDGNQGYEPVVFLPPVYPKIQLAPLPSKANIHPVYKEESQQSHKARVVPSNPKIAQKRKEIDASKHSDQSNLKRHRTDSFADLVDSPANGANAVVGRSVKASLSAREAGRQNENFSAHIPVQNELPDAMSEKSAKIESENHDNDDYGLLGRGALLLPVYSALLMANESTTVGKSISSCDDFVQNRFPCDTEEVSTLLLGNDDERLGSVALFVKKCPRILSPIGDLADQPHRPHIGLLQGDQRRILPNHAAPVDISTPVMTPQANGDEIGKKLKKKASGEGISSAFTRMPNAGVSVSGVPPIPTSVNPKSGHRHRMLATYASRQLGTGLSMFESASYRTAMLHVQKRIRKRIDMSLMKNCLSNETGPGIPMFASNHPKAITEIAQGVVHFGNFVEKLKEGSSTGDASKSLATVQRAALRRSLVSPCRVDFGPFEGGFLSSPTGMTAISPPRSRIGVSLPMGVKVAHVTHDQMQPTWTAQDDKQLQEAAVKFGMNWIVIARALSGVNGFVVADSGGSEFTRRLAPPPRSSRQCRDRWQYLARSQPSLAGEVRKSEKILRENALIRAESLVNSEDICTSSLGPSDQEGKIILLSRASLFANNVDDKMTIDGDISPNNAADVSNDVKMSSDRPKRSFSIFKAAMAKRQVVPLTLPGIPPGGQPNQPVPSHPSHMQSVQSSVAAQLSNGRTEMWPLQILDCADKHRAASRASAAQRSTDVPAASVPSTVARNPTTSTSSSSAVPPSGNLRAPVTNRPPATNVPSRTASVQRPATSSHPSPSKAKLVSDIGSQANVVPNSSPVAKKSDKSKTPASPTKKS